MNAVDITQQLRDAELERQISRAREDLVNAAPEDRRAKWEIMVELLQQRSPQQIARMEKQLGLR